MKEIVELRIEDVTREGDGVGHLAPKCEEEGKGKAVFVSGALIGERVRAGIVLEKKSFAKAELVEILEASPERVKPFCNYAHKCGGCRLSHLSYAGQLKLKEKWVKDSLERIGGFENIRLESIVGMEEPFRYRNKVEYALSKDGRVGFRPEKSHEIIDAKTCLLQTVEAEEAAEEIRAYIREGGNVGTGKAIVRTAFGTNDMMVALETAPYKYDIWTEDKVLREYACGLKWEISPASFFQVNTSQMERLYAKVKEYILEPLKNEITGERNEPNRNEEAESTCETAENAAVNVKKNETGEAGGATIRNADKKPVVLDLYCGTGSIGLTLSDIADHVLGIESVKTAVIDANRNAAINGIWNAEFLCGKAEEVLPEMFRTSPLGGEDYRPCIVFPSGFTAPCDVVVMDPPRAGCDERLLDAAVLAGPERIVYVSCDPATLARDLKYLAAKGYRPVKACPVDMFPHTLHVETVALLSKVKG